MKKTLNAANTKYLWERIKALVADTASLTSFTKEELDALLDDGIMPDGEEEI